MEELHAELTALVEKAKHARNTFPSLKAPDTLPAMTMAEELVRIGGEFIQLSIKLKRAARAEAAERAESRRLWSGPKNGAERLADALVKRGCYRVQL